ncbi:MAG TPA: heparan-alpha-glucosaminide N-acetyltransferase domain-containing protein [Vicinamibacterales bacterium]|nr:heparan-alpha-glucosaminide N-acetyltransferase domain-containing protein [Vicinamibacterales bacterium]
MMDGRPRLRRGYLDWLRGLAVLVMIEAHTVDAWTRPADDRTLMYRWALVLGGFGAPLFLFLAGVAVPLSAGSKARRFGSTRPAVTAVCRRGLEIFVLAFLFRLQSFLLSPGSPVLGLFKVDILNIMGPAIVIATLLWWLGRTPRGRLAVFAVATIGVAMVTPLVRGMTEVGLLPAFLQWYVRSIPGHTTFTLFPWAAFVFAGGLLGVLLDEAREADRERLTNFGALGAGVLLVAGGFWASYRPSIYIRSEFWTTSPTFVCIRIGIMCLTLALVYLHRGSAPDPGSVARGGPEAPRRYLHRGSAPDPGSVARGGPEAPRRSLAGALRAPFQRWQHRLRGVDEVMELMGRESLFVVHRGSAPDPGSVARGGPEAPRRSFAGVLRAPFQGWQHRLRGVDEGMELMGRESLFVYWIHVEMVYGLLTWPIHRRLPVAGTAAAYLLFSLLMYGAVVLKGRITARWEASGARIGDGQPLTA